MKLFSVHALAILLMLSLLPLSAMAAPTENSFVVAVDKIKVNGKKGRFGDLRSFVTGFLTRDKRYITVKKADDKTTHKLAVSFKPIKKQRKLKISIVGSLVGGESIEHSALLSSRPSQAAVEAEIMRAIRKLFDYKPQNSKVLVRILGTSKEGDADAGGVEDAIYRAIQSEYDQVPADPYKLPVTDKDVSSLYKGDKRKLAKIASEGGADLMIAGTIRVPATKNIGGATENRYRGKAIVRIRAWDLKRRMVLSDVKLDLHGEGIFSELIFSLLQAASEKSSAQMFEELGFPAPEVEEPLPEEELPAE